MVTIKKFERGEQGVGSESDRGKKTEGIETTKEEPKNRDKKEEK